MKIIKEGYLKPDIYVFECGYCGCIFELDRNDRDDQEDINSNIVAGCELVKARCPTCNRLVLGFEKEEEDADS